MQDFLNYITFESQANWAATIGVAVFSLIVALLHSLLIATLHSKKAKLSFKGGYLFIYPGIVILTKIIYPKYVFTVGAVLFVSLFLMFLVIMIINIIIGAYKHAKEESNGKNSSVLFLFLKYVLLVALLIIGLIFFNAYFFIFVFIYAGIQAFIKFNSKNSFINIQANLPTSTIASMAMGLVEVVGQVRSKEPLLTRIGKKECIGYRYKIEKRSRNKDGKDTYSTISDEVTCNPFILEDKTGKVEIRPNDIEFKWLAKDASYSSNGKRYTQYVLYDNDTILLVGKANSKGNSVFIEKESIRNIFALSPFNKVTKWNRYKPLLNSFLTFMTILLASIAFILISDIKLVENTLTFSFNLSWDNLNFKSPFK